MSKSEEYFEIVDDSPIPERIRKYGQICNLEGKIEELQTLRILSPSDAKAINKRIADYEKELEGL